MSPFPSPSTCNPSPNALGSPNEEGLYYLHPTVRHSLPLHWASQASKLPFCSRSVGHGVVFKNLSVIMYLLKCKILHCLPFTLWCKFLALGEPAWWAPISPPFTVCFPGPATLISFPFLKYSKLLPVSEPLCCYALCWEHPCTSSWHGGDFSFFGSVRTNPWSLWLTWPPPVIYYPFNFFSELITI